MGELEDNLRQNAELFSQYFVDVLNNLGADPAVLEIAEHASHPLQGWWTWLFDISDIKHEGLMCAGFIREFAVNRLGRELSHFLYAVASQEADEIYASLRSIILYILEVNLVVNSFNKQHIALKMMDKGFENQIIRIIESMQRDHRWSKEGRISFLLAVKSYCVAGVRAITENNTPVGFDWGSLKKPVLYEERDKTKRQTAIDFFRENYYEFLQYGFSPKHLKRYDFRLYNALNQSAHRGGIRLAELFYFTTLAEFLITREQDIHKNINEERKKSGLKNVPGGIFG